MTETILGWAVVVFALIGMAVVAALAANGIAWMMKTFRKGLNT